MESIREKHSLQLGKDSAYFQALSYVIPMCFLFVVAIVVNSSYDAYISLGQCNVVLENKGIETQCFIEYICYYQTYISNV